MIAVDTSILVRAHREELPLHEEALQRLTELAEGREPWGIPIFCLGELVRVVTHPKILDPPSTLDQALAALEGLLASPSAQLLIPGPRFASRFAEVVRGADARGNLVFDAQIAALCLEHDASLLTLDKDFDRFKGLELHRLP